MGFSLRNLLEETAATINPFDGGKTASTVRAARPPAPPAQTVSRPTPLAPQQAQSAQQRQAPSYGSGFTGSFNKLRDVFDANSQQDKFKRSLVGDSESYRDQQVAMGNTRPYQNVGGMLAGSTARLVNTLAAVPSEVVDTRKALFAQARGDQEDLASTNARIARRQEEQYRPDSGIFGQGTVFNGAEDMRTKGALDLTKDVVATTAGSGLEILPMTKGAGLAGSATYKAASAPGKVGLRTAAGAVEGAGQDILEQQVSRDNYSPGQTLASAGFGAVLPNAMPAAGAVANRAKGVTTRLVNSVQDAVPSPRPLNQTGSVRLPFTAGEPNSRLLAVNNPDNARVGRLPINNPDGARVRPLDINNPMGANTGRPLQVSNNTGAPLVGENISGAAQQSFMGKARSRLLAPMNEEGSVRNPFVADPEAQIRANFDKLDRIGQAADRQAKNIDEARGIYREGNLPSSNEGSLLKAVDQKLEVPVPRKRLFAPLDEKGSVRNPFSKDLESAGIKPKTSRFAQGVTRSGEVSPELQASVKKASPTYVPIENADQVKVSEQLVKRGYKKAATDVTERLHVKEGTIDGQTVADTIHVIKTLDSKGGTANLQKATELSEQLSGHLTKAGQTVQAASLLNNRTPEGMLYGARKFLKNNGVELTDDMQKQFKAKIAEITKAKGEDRLYKIAELQQIVEHHVPSSKVDKAVGLWKAGLLTGIKTQTGNTLSGAATNVLKIASDVPAAVLDTGFAALGKTKAGKKLGFTGQRSKAFTMRGSGSGLAEGVKKGAKSLVTGIDERNIETSKFDTKRLVFSDKPLGKIAQRYTDTVYGLMGAADRPNYYMNLRRNLNELAIVDAKNKGLSGSAREQAIKEFTANPPQKAFQTATNAAERSIFANETQLSKWAGSLRNASKDNPGANAAVNILMPFTKVPSSVAMRLVDYSPVGAVKTVVQQIAKAKKTGMLDQRALSEGLAEAGVGTGAMFLGYKLKEAGLMTGSYPTDDKEKRLWELEGKQANSIKVGGKWQSINYTSPLGQVLATGSKAYDAKKEGKSGVDAISTAAASTGKTITEQSFLQGVQGGLSAIQDPERSAGKFVKSQAGSIIPTLSNDIGKATDKFQRQSNSIPDAIKGRIPGVNQTLLPKQDAFGAPIPRASSAINTMVNPFRPSDVRESTPLNSELRRLQDAQYGVMPNTDNKQITFGSKEKGNLKTINLTPQQLFDKNNSVGQLVQKKWNEIISNPQYASMTDYEKQKALGNVLEDANALGKGEYAAKNDPALLDLQKLTKNQIKLSQGGDASTYINGATKTGTAVTNPKDRYTSYKESYDQKLKNGEFTEANRIKAESTLKRYDVQKDYEQGLVDSYTLSGAKLDALLRADPNGGNTWKKLQELDDKMAAAGFTPKFRDKYGNEKKPKTTTAKTSKAKGKGGKKSAKAKAGKFDYTKSLANSASSVSSGSVTNSLRKILASATVKNSRKR